MKKALLMTIKRKVQKRQNSAAATDARQAERQRSERKEGGRAGGESGRYLSSHCWDAPYNNETKRKIQDAAGAVLALQLSAYIEPMGKSF